MEEVPEPTEPRGTPRETAPPRYVHDTGFADPPPFFRTKPFAIGISVWAAGFALAFLLSWRTNSNWNRGLFAKLSYGMGAGMHSWSYLVLWLMYVWGRHNPAAFVSKLPVLVVP